MLILAIDPGTKSLGYSLFKNGTLIKAASVNAHFSKERYARSREILFQLLAETNQAGFKSGITSNQQLVCEEPVTQGFASLALNRLLGQIELAFDNEPVYIKPTSVKAAMGKGTLDKAEVRDAVLDLLTEDEVNLLKSRDDFDMFDSIAVGLTHLGRTRKMSKKKKARKRKPLYRY